MKSSWTQTILIIIVALMLAIYVYPQGWNRLTGDRWHYEGRPFRLGLDLVGGAHLVYEADLSRTGGQSQSDAMKGVRDVIERRVNAFGVSEPLVQIESDSRLIVELAGIHDVSAAIAAIGQTPFLEFKEARTASESQEILAAQEKGERLEEDPFFKSTGLTGQYLELAQYTTNSITGQPEVAITFDDEGTRLFGQLTERNIGNIIGIYLDTELISFPQVSTAIYTGQATISGGDFTVESAQELARRLNAGALPVPISLISQQKIGPSLGAESLAKSLKAGLYGFIGVALFMIIFYRLPGLIAVLALAIYVLMVLALYKAWPVTLTLAGIAGFILSLGIAVDANVLIFERIRDELRSGKPLHRASQEGLGRAWYSIRDGHMTTFIGALVLFAFTTSLVKGFALTLGLGVMLSFISSVYITKTFLAHIANSKRNWVQKLF